MVDAFFGPAALETSLHVMMTSLPGQCTDFFVHVCAVFVLLEAARPHLRAHVVDGDGVVLSGEWRCCAPSRCVAVLLLKLSLHQCDTGGILRVNFRTSRGRAPTFTRACRQK